MHNKPRGFTLVEVMVAVTIGGMVVLAAHVTMGQATDAAAALRAARRSHDQEMRGRSWLAATIGSLDVTADRVGFLGHPATIRFATDSGGPIEIAAAAGWLRATSRYGVTDLLRADAVAYDYLLHAGANESWMQQWISPVSAPVAVRMRIRRPTGNTDTLLFAIGPRG